MAESASTPPAEDAPQVPAPVATPPAAGPLPTASATAEKTGPAILAITTPHTTTSFVHGIEGWAPITRSGTAGPAESADAVIEAAKTCGVELERR